MDTYPPLSTFLSLRRWIGYVGVSLPWLVALFAWRICPSISDSYYAGATPRTWFTGSLFTIGAFLCSYFGYDKTDRWMSTAAGLCAFGVALFPTDPAEVEGSTVVGLAHYGFAAALFLMLAWFARFQFVKTGPGANPSRRKLQRNRIYVACGYGILACLSALLLLKVTPLGAMLKGANPVFWLETTALQAFGFSWLVKGEVILQDEPQPPKAENQPASVRPASG